MIMKNLFNKIAHLSVASLLFVLKLTGQNDALVAAPANPYLFTIDSFQHKVPLKDYVWMLEDPNDQYEITDMFRSEVSNLFRPVKETGKYIYRTEERPWGKISLQNMLSHPTLWSPSFHFLSDSILIYIVDKNHKIDSLKVGTKIHPKNTKNGSDLLGEIYSQFTPIFIYLEKGEQKDIYFKIFPTIGFDYEINLTMRSMESSYRMLFRKMTDYTKAFFYLGLIWMFVLYNLLIFFFYKDKTYLYLSLYALCFALPSDHFTLRFLIKTWLPDFLFLLDVKWLVLNPLLIITIGLFSRSLLNTKINYPKSDKYIKAIILIGGIFLLVAVFDYLITQQQDIRRTNPYLYIVSGIVITMFILIFRDLYKTKNTIVLFWLAGMSFLIISQLFSLYFQIFVSRENYLEYVEFFGVFSPLAFGVLGQIAIFTLGAGYRSREVAEAKKELEEREQIKSRFFANISHEFRTPLTLLLGPINELMENTRDPKDKELLEMARRNAHRQLQLVNQLLDLSKLDAGKMDLRASREDFIPFLKGVAHAYESLARERKVGLTINCPDGELPLYFNRDKMEKICYNLFSNAFKFTPPGGKISVGLQKVNDKAVLTVADTGIGISEERLPNIFDRFFQAGSGKNEVQEGSGIGLTLVHELVQLHGGTIAVKSSPGKGTTFTLEFPLGKNHLQPDDIVDLEHQISGDGTSENWSPPAYLVAAEGTTDTAARSPKNAPRVLVVEDNADVRAFIRLRLQQSFHITEATDGQEGFKKAIERMPDLIISDVMMPKKNGYELCEALKTDLRTSHIPIILLTAKAAQEEKLEGLQTGADDYLTKPFDSKELEIRAHNLIRLRQQLRERFAESISLKPSEVATNSVDQTFLEDALRIVEANIGNEQFSIEMLAREIGMSRPNLNRKFRALINQSSNQFIQSVRLQRAADLLRQGAGSVSEIAFRTGFSSTAYFVKCFKDHFGETPGSVLKSD